jgi:hypothetical protein
VRRSLNRCIEVPRHFSYEEGRILVRNAGWGRLADQRLYLRFRQSLQLGCLPGGTPGGDVSGTFGVPPQVSKGGSQHPQVPQPDKNARNAFLATCSSDQFQEVAEFGMNDTYPNPVLERPLGLVRQRQ